MLTLPLVGVLMLMLQPLLWHETSLRTSSLPGMEMRIILMLRERSPHLPLMIGLAVALRWHVLWCYLPPS